ncbi:MAG TPA: hypothetical protein VMR21_15545 [Vicinamibacteria bacterium]|nr:hypothetical protein [Vicinamibacteria bacterium]
MSTAAVVVLGVIAVAALVQAALLVVLGRELLGMGRRIALLQERLGRELRPLVQDLSRATHDLSTASELTELQARRIDALVEGVIDRLAAVERAVEEVVIPPATRIAGWLATLRTFATIVGVYRERRG